LREELLSYYERELTFLRQMGAEFAEKYPKIASRLLLEADRCEDPHVERLLEGFALLAARVHLKIDDDFPEITQALLNIVYPHFIRPIPSMTVVQFHLDPEQGKLTTGYRVPRGSLLYSKPVEGVPLKFRTCHETTLWPVQATHAEWRTPDRLQPAVRSSQAVAAVRVELQCLPDVTFDALELDRLRFYLSGESNLVHTLYELLFNNCTEILVRARDGSDQPKTVSLPGDQIEQVGLSKNEALLPYPGRSFIGYRLLQEYFAFPEGFFFVDLKGLLPVWNQGFKDKVELIFLLSRFERPERQQTLELGLSAKTFRLGCSPAVNLFPQSAEPILLDRTRFQYAVVPDVRRQPYLEAFSVDEVVGSSARQQDITKFEPLFSYRHSNTLEKGKAYWYASRRASNKPDDHGTEVDLALVDLAGNPAYPDVDTLTVRITCTNRDLPSRVPFGSEEGDFEMEGATAISRIVSLRKPTPTLRPPLRRDAFWPMISQLSLNYLSLVEEGKEALQELLRLYNFTGSVHSERQIEGISRLSSRRHFARVVSEHGISLVRGTQVSIEFDEDQFVGGGTFLFASVVERFLGHYVSMNSFSQLVARTLQRKEVMREWQPRSGERVLL
jgi:type VI secretion system protein ImpG